MNIYFSTHRGGSGNNGNIRLEQNTTYTLSVYAKKSESSDSDQNFRLFAYDGKSNSTHQNSFQIVSIRLSQTTCLWIVMNLNDIPSHLQQMKLNIIIVLT